MERLILASNRLPVTVDRNKDNNFVYQQSSGGLATGLSSVYNNYNGFWLGWPGITEENITQSEKQRLRKKLAKEKNHPLFLTENEINNYYYGFCNKTIWPLFHYFTRYTHYPDKYWQAYKKVNQKFFHALKNRLKKNDNLWIHDYHLMLLPQLVRQKFSNINIGFFLHIPFPSFEIFRLLPWREEILNGLLGADVIGFHTYGYVRHFLSSVLRILGYDHEFNKVKLGNRNVTIDLFPMGIDYDKFNQAPAKKEVQNEISNIKKEKGEARIILSVDRLDYTKGVPERLRAFDYFLEKNPQYQGKVTLIIIAVPSRTKIEKYEELKIEVNELVGDINGKYGTLNWSPVQFLFKSIPFKRLVALYNYADVCLVTPLRDGMNLVSKEFVAASHNKGVLILSEMAGSSYELSNAINITPTRKEEIADSILKALQMSKKEQIKRLQMMQKRIENYNVKKWANSFVNTLVNTKPKIDKNETQNFDQQKILKITNDYKKARHRLIIIDYDIFKTQNKKDLFNWLKHLTKDKSNSLIILSEAIPEELHKIFMNINCYILSEYGQHFYNSKKWETLQRKNTAWMKDIEPIIQMHKENTPGAFVEKRSNSIKWFYQRAEPELAQLRKKELQDTLTYFSRDFDVDIIEGKNFLEIKSSSTKVNDVIYNIVQNNNFDFFLVIGNLNRYPEINTYLPDIAHIFEINSSRINQSYKLINQNILFNLL